MGQEDMGNRGSLRGCLEPQEIRAIQEETGFSPGQIDRLHTRFRKLDVERNGFLQRQDFLRIPELTINPLGDRIIHAFFHGREDRLEFQDCVSVLSFFRPLSRTKAKNKTNSKENKLLFSFRMYDLDGDGSITVDELLAVLTMMMDNIEEKELYRIAEKFVEELDASQDTLISSDEFVRIMESCDAENKMSMRFVS